MSDSDSRVDEAPETARTEGPDDPVEESDPRMIAEEEVVPTLFTKGANVEAPPQGSVATAIALASLAAFAGTVLTLRILAVSLVPHIFRPGNFTAFRDVDDRLPVPQLLNWNRPTVDSLQMLADVSPAGWTLIAGILGVFLFLLAVHIIDPSLRLVRSQLPLPTSGSDSLSPIPVRDSSSCDDAQTMQGDIPSNGPGSGGPAHLSAAAAPPGPRAPSSYAISLSFSAAAALRFLRLLLIGGIPTLVVWSALGSTDQAGIENPMRPGALPWLAILRAAVIGAGFWLTFHPCGPAGDRRPATLPARLRSVVGLVAAGVTYGILVHLLGSRTLPNSVGGVLARYQTLGTFNQQECNEILLRCLTAGAAFWFAACALMIAVTRTLLPSSRRFVVLGLAAAAGFTAIVVEGPLAPARMLHRFDLTRDVTNAAPRSDGPDNSQLDVPNGPLAGSALARLTGVAIGASAERPPRDILVFLDRDVAAVRQEGITEDGLSAGRSSLAPVSDFLRSREYRTALSWTAVKHIFNVGPANFDQGTAIEACLTDLENCPHAGVMSATLRSLLFTCATSARNLASVDRWADERRFAHSTRFSRRLIADLYLRFGETDKAISWYRRADMPRSFMHRIRGQRPPFRSGVVSGVMTLNGHPLVGASVGAVPLRLNIVPADLWPDLQHTPFEVLALQPFSDMFPVFHPRPYALRWVTGAALTDSKGRFNLTDLYQGYYFLVATLPPDIQMSVPHDSRLTVHNPPLSFSLSYDYRRVDLGVIAVSIKN